VAAVLALFRQNGPNLVHFGAGHQRPMGPAMARLSSRLPSAFLAPAPLSRFTGQSIGGRRFGRVRGVLFALRQLALQVRNLLLGVRDLALLFGDLFGLSVELLFPVRQLPA